MEVFKLMVPAGFYLGKPDDNFRVAEDTIYYFAAKDLESAQQVATAFLGERGSTSFSFAADVVDVAAVIKTKYDDEAEQRKIGHVTDEEKHVRKLLKKAAFDLGSINIDRALFALSNDGKQFIGARIEASEGDRRRIVYLEDERDAFSNLKAETIIQAVEVKF